MTNPKNNATQVEKRPWGTTTAGEPLELFTLTEGAVSITITNLGATVVTLQTPDRDGRVADIVLGYGSAAGYEADRKCYFGAVVGRFANRIAKGKFALDGKTFTIPLNNGINALHGGPEGFDRKVWKAEDVESGVELTLVSPDGDMGFPGELTVKVRYTLRDSALTLDYTATSSKTTTLNVTNHSYFNLAGESSGTILDQRIMIEAEHYTPVKPDLIPTGELAPVEGTPFDFRRPTAIGAHIAEQDAQLKIARGYDHNFVLSGFRLENEISSADASAPMHLAAEVTDQASGRLLRVETTEPGVQFYSGNFLDGEFTGKSGKPYLLHGGFCLETQHFPDSPNQAHFPGTTLRPGEVFRSTTVFTFGLAE